MDSRIIEYAQILVDYSTKVKKGDSVTVHFVDYGEELVKQIIGEVVIKGARTTVLKTPSDLLRNFYSGEHELYGYYGSLSEIESEMYPLTAEKHLSLFQNSDVVIMLKSSRDPNYLAGVPEEKRKLRREMEGKITNTRLEKRWCLAQVATPGWAERAGMNVPFFEDFIYSACIRDWKKFVKEMGPLRNVMQKTENVRIIGEKTGITFSIKDSKAVISDGTHNMPGGEVYIMPVKESVKGEIYFDRPVFWSGEKIEGIHLRFRNGKVVDYSAEKNQKGLENMLSVDEGAKYVGEFGFGMNEGIKKITFNELFDEKMAGNVHLAVGRSIPDSAGTNQMNKSNIHQDLIKDMKGGVVMFDNKIVLKDGKILV